MVSSLVWICFDSPQLGIKSKQTVSKNLDYWFRDMFNLEFLENSLGIVSSPYFVYDFSRKMFLMLYSIRWTNFIVGLALLLAIVGNMCIAIVCFPGSDVINFDINLIFVTKPFFLWEQKVKRMKCLENEMSF